MTQPPYSAPGYAPPGYVGLPPQRTNGLAIAAFVLAFFFSLLGLILGYVARSQIRESGEGGAGLALAAIIIGWVSIGIVALVFLGYVVVIALFVTAPS